MADTDGTPVVQKLAEDLSAGAQLKPKKDSKAEKKKEKAQERGVKQTPTDADPEDPLRDQYGDLPMVQSQGVSGRTWSRVEDINPTLKDQKVLVRARVHTVRGKGKSAFLVLRQRHATIQAIMFADDQTISRQMVKYASAITRESIVDLEGVVACPQNPVEACSQKDVELQVRYIRVVSRAAAMPFDLVDAARNEEEVKKAAEAGTLLPTVSTALRLDYRYIDLRTPANQAIFRLQSAVCQIFRGTLLARDFQEIHTPKLIAGASEGGASVFKLDYMGQPACLAQSPQLYKQMVIAGDCERVFEIGPVFRAENSDTHRHLCEFTGLDLEMAINEHYDEVMDVIEALFMALFDGLAKDYATELAVIGQQYPFEPLIYRPCRLTFEEGIKLLQENGYPDVDPMGDLNTELERALGAVVRKLHKTDFYILHRYPSAVRPFYTMPCSDDARYSNSYDVFIRGEEIISGAQRIHDSAMLARRAEECGIEVPTIQSYVDSFKYGAPPHGGAGVGLERVVMLYAALGNVRKTSMFPRDPKRLTP